MASQHGPGLQGTQLTVVRSVKRRNTPRLMYSVQPGSSVGKLGTGGRNPMEAAFQDAAAAATVLVMFAGLVALFLRFWITLHS